MESNRMTILNYIRKFKFKEIKSVIFTTYNFDKDFFDKNILPAILDIKPSKNEKALVHSSNEKLSKIPVAIFYDFNALSEQYNYNSSYKYQLKGIKLPNGFFHTKNIIICGKDTNDKPIVICTVASANLTRSAYASNIEVFSHIEITGKDENSNALLSFLKRLQEISQDKESKNINALEQSIEFIENELIRSVQKSDKKLKFVLDKDYTPFGILNELFSNNKEITLISPYWTDEMINELPINENNKAIISKIENAFTLSKAGFEKLIEKKYKVYYSTLLDSNKKERFLHAKCYIAKEGNNYKIALGSSNFTKSGLGILGSSNFTSSGLGNSGYNIESMLFFEEKIDNDFCLIDNLNLITEIPTDDSKFIDASNVPMQIPFDISVTLDWSEKKYHVKILKSSANNPILYLPGIDSGIKFEDTNKPIPLNNQNIISNTFTVKYFDKDNYPAPNYIGFILELNLDKSQREYFYRFSYSEILDSWIKLKDINHYLSDESDDSEEFNDIDLHYQEKYEKTTDIIDNYYEIYRAFYNLRNELENKKDEKEFLILTGPTSLLKLFESIKNNDTKDNKVDEVLNFLILLEIQDILEKNEYPLFDNLAEEIQKIEKHIIYGNLTRDRLDWFKTKLFLK